MSRDNAETVGGLLFMLFMWCGVAAGWWERWHPSKTTRPVDLSGLWFMTIVFVIAPAVVVLAGCCVLCYVGLLRLIRPRRGQRHPQQPSQPPPEEIERQKREAERRRQVEEEKKARAEWERYHRFRRIEEVDEMTGLQFEELLITLFGKAGYQNVRGTPINDQGADIECNSSDGRKGVVQAKRWKARVGNGAVQEVLGAMVYYHADFAFVVTTSDFTDSARALAAKDPRITLIDRRKLVEMIDRHWPQEIPEFDWDEYNKNVKGRHSLRERTARQSQPPRF